MTHLEADDTDPLFTDTDTPAVGSGFCYLKTIVDDSGPSDLGATSSGLARRPATGSS